MSGHRSRRLIAWRTCCRRTDQCLRSLARFHAISRQTMAARSFRRRSTNGRTRTAWRLTSRVLASQPTTRRTNPSTDVSGRNASTRIGSCRRRTPDAKSKSDASTLTRRVLILRCSGLHRRNSSTGAPIGPIRTALKSRNIPPKTGRKLGRPQQQICHSRRA